MPAAWRLATKSVFDRPSRAALLIATVALSAALIAAVAFAMASLNKALEGRVESTVGTADLRVQAAGSGKTFDDSVLEIVRSWPEAAAATPKLQAPLSLRFSRPQWSRTNDLDKTSAEAPGDTVGDSAEFVRRTATFASSCVANGLTAGGDSIKALTFLSGRAPTSDREIVLDKVLADRLSKAPKSMFSSFSNTAAPKLAGRGNDTAGSISRQSGSPATVSSASEAEKLNEAAKVRVGDSVEIARLLRRNDRLEVVGIVAQPPLGGRPQAYMTFVGLAKLADQRGKLTEIEVILKPGVDPEAVAKQRRTQLAAGLSVQTTAKVTSGLDRNVRSNQLGLLLASVMSFLAAAFIITTGLTTGVTEKQRELAILRCLGAERGLLGRAQLLVGLILGGIGAAIGLPLGVLAAWLIVTALRAQVPGGLAMSWLGVVLAPAGALISGLIGAAVPAWQASRVSPLRALASRSVAPKRKWLTRCVALGALGVAIQLLSVGLPRDGQVAFWSYATVGLPAMFTGYFLLGVPTVLIAVWTLGRPLSTLLGLPPALLTRTIRATPYRHGFTAGALMGGLALMVAIWTQGSSILRDWLGKLDFPEAFVTGLNLTKESQAKLDAMPFVTHTCAITLHPVQTDAFGVKALQSFNSTFVAFDPEPFFRMAKLVWVQGDEKSAIRRLNEGGAVIVAREFLVARGLGVGSTFECSSDGKNHSFEIVGVITSPGLDVISKFFNVGDEYAEQSVHAVFGSRRDLSQRFASDAIHMIQIGLRPEDQPGGVSDSEAIAAIQRELFDAGILDAGSGRQIKQDITTLIKGSLLAVSMIALFAMLIACFGVANLIIAGISARQFEFGVLRAVGASGGLAARLVLAEVVVVALAACVLGTLMGFQGAYAGRRLNEMLLGLELTFNAPVGAIAVGWVIVVVMALGAAAPAARGLSKKRPRELLAVAKG